MSERGVRIHFEELLGRGGFGSVYRARMMWRDGLTRRVAVKVLNADVQGIEEAVTRTRDEARVLLRLNHDNIIGVLDLTEIQGRPAMIMEYVDGCDLKSLMRDGPMPPRAVLGVVAAVASGLYAANRGTDPHSGKPLSIVHRDVKPGNVIVSVAGSVKLLDFGVAFGNLDRESQTRVDHVGTMRYMAPEQFLGGGVAHQSDIYSLGLVCAELLLGRTLQRLPAECEKFEARVAKLLDEVGELGLEGDWGERVCLLLGRMLDFVPFARPDGAEVRDLAEILHDTGDGLSLKAYARRRVPLHVDDRRVRYADAELLQDVSITEFGSVSATEDPSSSGGMWLAATGDKGFETSAHTIVPTSIRSGDPENDPTEFAAEERVAEGGQTGRGAWWLGLGMGLAIAVLAAALVLSKMIGMERGSQGSPSEEVASTTAAVDEVSGGELVLAETDAAVESAVEGSQEVVGEEVSPEVAEPVGAEPEVVPSSEAGTPGVVQLDPSTPVPSSEEPSGDSDTEPTEGQAAPEGDLASTSADGDVEVVVDASVAEPEAEPEEVPEEVPVEAAHFAGLSGTWSGTAGGQQSRFKLSFDAEGGVRGVVDMYIGGSRSVVPVSGTYRAIDWDSGSIELLESEGRRPATYAGKIADGNVVSGSLSIQGKVRGEWHIRRGEG